MAIRTRAARTRRDHLAHFAEKAALTSVELFSLRGWLGEQLVGDVRAKLEQGGHTENQTPLQRVFVDLPVTSEPHQNVERVTEANLFLQSFMSAAPVLLKDSCQHDVPSGGDAPRRRFHPGEPEVKVGVLLIGGPGQGKSTLGQFACQLHRAALLKPAEADLPEAVLQALFPFFEEESVRARRKRDPSSSLHPPVDPLLPLRVVLPELSGWLAQRPPRTVPPCSSVFWPINPAPGSTNCSPRRC